MWSGLPPEDTSLGGAGVLTANEAMRSFQIAMALKLQRAHCPSGNVLCQGLGEERSRRSEAGLQDAMGSLPLGVEALQAGGKAGGPGKGLWKSSPHLAVCSLPCFERAAGDVR